MTGRLVGGRHGGAQDATTVFGDGEMWLAKCDQRSRSLYSCFRDELRWELVLDHFSGKRGVSRITPELPRPLAPYCQPRYNEYSTRSTMWLLPTYTSDRSECEGGCVGSTSHVIFPTLRNP